MIQHSVDDASGTLVVEWDNRDLAKSRFLAVVLPLFWIMSTPITAFVTWLLVKGEIWLVGGLLWLIVGYAIVILIPLTCLTQYSKERIELSETEYRHWHVTYPWFFPTRWRLADVSQIEIGRYDEKYDLGESIVTLNIWKGSRRDIVAYWANNEFRYEIFQIIAQHLGSTDYEIEVLDNFGSWQTPTRDSRKAESH